MAKLCMIFSSLDGYYLFTEDVNKGKMPSNDILNLNIGPRFFFRGDDQPIVKKVSVMLDGFAHLCFCVVGEMLYMFEGSRKGRDEGKARRAYVLPLCHLSEAASEIVGRHEAQQVSRMRGPKVEPAAVRYRGDKVIVFSTNIQYLACGGDDFELYIVGKDRYWPLSCLSVCHFYCSDSGVTRYTLYDPTRGCRKVAERTVREAAAVMRTYSSSFSITAFTLKDDRALVVQTDFGLRFSLNLEQNEWEFYDAPPFPCAYENFVTNDELVLCPFGATPHHTRGGNGHFSGVTVPLPLTSRIRPMRRDLNAHLPMRRDLNVHFSDVAVPFPLTSRIVPRYDQRNFIISLEQAEFPYYFPSILQLGYNRDVMLIWTVDMLKVNTKLMPRDGNEDEDKDKDEKFAECMKSFKFIWPTMWGDTFEAEALFLF